jgi:prepilin-type N-terminal cleavage/methylation domain-containing protein
MKISTDAARHARVARRRPGEQGVTMIELLLSLAILVVLTGFVAGGLSMGRRAFDADRINEIASETDAAIQVISSTVGSALPVHVDMPNQSGVAAFDGRQDGISFVGLSEGRSLLGGPHKISLRRSGSDIVVNLMTSPVEEKKQTAEPLPREVVVLQGVRELRFGYFGRTKSSAAPGWQTDWFGSERLPDLVSIQIDFEDERRNEPSVIVALRQQ